MGNANANAQSASAAQDPRGASSSVVSAVPATTPNPLSAASPWGPWAQGQGQLPRPPVPASAPVPAPVPTTAFSVAAPVFAPVPALAQVPAPTPVPVPVPVFAQQHPLFQSPAPAAWAKGLAPPEQFSWIIDCFRLRLHDSLRLLSPDVYHLEAEQIFSRILIFCKLAVARSVLPTIGWHWAAFLNAVHEKAVLPLDKKVDIEEKYGSQNIFKVMVGSRSLSYTAEVIYGFHLDSNAPIVPDIIYKRIESEVLHSEQLHWRNGRMGYLTRCFDRSYIDFFQDVGGPHFWMRFLDSLETNQRNLVGRPKPLN